MFKRGSAGNGNGEVNVEGLEDFIVNSGTGEQQIQNVDDDLPVIQWPRTMATANEISDSHAEDELEEDREDGN